MPRRLVVTLALAAALALAPSPASAKKLSPGETVDLNSAAADELARVPGIGKKKAADIVAHRAAHGPFQSVDELDGIKGFGKKALQKVAPYLRLGTAPAVAPAPPAIGGEEAIDEAPKAKKLSKRKKPNSEAPPATDAAPNAPPKPHAPPATPQDQGSGKGDVETL